MTGDAIPTRPTPRAPLAVAAAIGAACLVAAIVTALHSHAVSAPVSGATAASARPATGGGVGADIVRLQQRLHVLPRDDSAWASLGLDYVQQAKITVDPTYYPKAAGALHRSLQLQRSDNFLAMAGEAALAAARHDFRAALHWARRGLRIDPQSAVLYGALTDALTQLGHYTAAAHAARHMELLSPGTPAEARLSYAAELRGDHPAAVAFMRQALADAAGPSDIAFTRYYLGDLAFSAGEPRQALRQYTRGLAVAPTDTALLEGRARAEAALGRTAAAVHDFASVVQRVPQPTYVLEYGDLLQSLGRTAQARQQWQLFRTENRLFRANGVTLDSDATLFEADHGDPAQAVKLGAAAISTRPFLDSYDAYAWALHNAGHDHAALSAADSALRTGMHNALFLYHRGEIERELGMRAAARADLTTALRVSSHFSPLWSPVARAHLAALRARA